MHTAKLISLRDKSLTQIAFNFPYDLHKVQDFIVLSRILFTKYFIGYLFKAIMVHQLIFRSTSQIGRAHV